MKKFILIRHAQAQLEQYGHIDKDRPITIVGMQELEAIRDKISGKLAGVTLVVCSNAKRTRQTLDGLRSLLPSNLEIIYDDDLYNANAEIVLQKIQNVRENHEGVIIISHNPGLSDLINRMHAPQGISLPKVMPTCGILVGESLVESWTQISPHNTQIKNFIIP